MGLRFAHLRSRRQKLVEIPAPPRRVFTLAITAYGGPIEDCFDPATDAIGRLWFGRPDRLYHFHDEAGIDCLERDIADQRISIGLQRRRPLRRMLVVLPGH